MSVPERAGLRNVARHNRALAHAGKNWYREAMQSKPELIIAYDAPDLKASMRVASRLLEAAPAAQPHELPWAKIGLQRFCAEGPDVVRAFKEMGFRIFLDLKLHDIPNTITGAVNSIAGLGVGMFTIHASGGKAMVKAAVEATSAFPEPCKVLAVTALTSLSDKELAEAMGFGGLNVPGAVFAMAVNARDWGAGGIVCSGWDIRSVKALGLPCVVPGVRPAGSNPNDQHVVVTPRMAAFAGADYIVVGRPITESADPARAAEQIMLEAQGAAAG
jgi:orotidine-5'-phosphate decarboxylase